MLMSPHRKARSYRQIVIAILPILLAVVSLGLLATGPREGRELWRAQMSALRRATGLPQLLAVEAVTPGLPVGTAVNGEMCQWLPASASSSLVGSMSAMLAPALQEGHGATFDPKDT